MLEGFQPRLGAVPLGDGRTRFRVWAPKRQRVSVLLDEATGLRALPLEAEADGYFSGTHRASTGALYRYQLDGGEAYPDPASRFQPQGPHGPSEIIDPNAFEWSDHHWAGGRSHGNIIYELHVGAYTPEGRFDSLLEQLPHLAALGVTTIELMPVNGFPGEFNWGYDGVNLFAPNATYGRPDDLRRLVNRAHELKLHVILDVVYNHFGPDGNYLPQFTDTLFSRQYPSEWGDPPNFDGEGSSGVRELVVESASAWVAEYHLDGLRFDATQNLFDRSAPHITAALVAKARAAAHPRTVFLVAESESQDRSLLDRSGFDAIWVDDFHHAARVMAGGPAEAYLQDYAGRARELCACAIRNALYQGQRYTWQNKPRGSDVRDVDFARVVFYLQNHDQVANSLRGERLHQMTSPAMARALTSLLLLLPQTPMLFMGQEWFASTPFLFFSQHDEALQRAVNDGRRGFLLQFPSVRAALDAGVALPHGRAAFERSKLSLNERTQHLDALAFHRALIALRHSNALFSRPAPDAFAAASLSDSALTLRWSDPDGHDWLLLFNAGADVELRPCSEPLLAPPSGRRWSVAFSSEDGRFGGRGGVHPCPQGDWRLQGTCATVLEALP